MKIKLFFTLIFSLHICTAYSALIKDLYFEIHSDELKSLVEENYALKKIGPLYCKVYWLKNRSEVVVVGKDLENPLRDTIKDACVRKSKLALPTALESYLEGFEKVKSSDGWVVYQDKTGLSDKNEILVKAQKSSTRLIEKRAIGTTKLHYYYRRFKKQKVLRKVEISSYEGIQNVQSTINIIGHGRNKFYLPKKVVVNTAQNLIKKGVGSYSRNLKENYYFKEYKINRSKAVLYFSRK